MIVASGQEVYVYEHIYESINQLAENRAGGLWLPDELSRFLQKAKQYRELFPKAKMCISSGFNFGVGSHQSFLCSLVLRGYLSTVATVLAILKQANRLQKQRASFMRCATYTWEKRRGSRRKSSKALWIFFMCVDICSLSPMCCFILSRAKRNRKPTLRAAERDIRRCASAANRKC